MIIIKLTVGHFSQLAVDREVLRTIAKVREEIRILRETYAAKKAKSRALSSMFKVPSMLEGRRLRRLSAKPPLVMRKECGTGSAWPEAYKVPRGLHHSRRYTVLEKEE